MQDWSVTTAGDAGAGVVDPHPASDPYLPGSGNDGYSVLDYQLELDYRINTNRLVGTATITAIATGDLRSISLDLVGMTATNVLIDGSRAIRYRQTLSKLIITPARPVPSGATFALAIRYAGTPRPRRSSWGEVGWEELTDGVLTANQPSGAPTWFPCNDHPSDKATFTVGITVASSYRAVANGRLISQTAKAGRTRWVYSASEPMATYLATIQIGQYELRRIPAGDSGVAQFAYIPPDLKPEFAHDFAAHPEMVATFERLFGRYPFDLYAVVVTDDELDIPLEAQGLSIFGRNHVDGHGGSTRLIAHELAHSWFGNSLTAESWQHIWLHEGFACYAEWLWSENSGGPSAQKLAEQHWARLRALPQDFAIGDPGAKLMFDDRLYKRGALTLHALRRTLGDAVFFGMLQDWTEQHRFGSVSTDAFRRHAQSHTRKRLTPFFQKWLFEDALPSLPKA
jgi:aminopeptidase N